MEVFPLVSFVLVLAALFSWLNHRYLRLPTTIGVMALSLGASILVLLLDAAGLDLRAPAVRLLERLSFREAVLEVLLAFLLFAGALHVDLGRLVGQGRVIGLLATVGVMVSTFLVGAATWFVLPFLGLEIRFIDGLLFGALISPTDPIAVLGILKRLGVSKGLETKIAGESLFNDGVGVVVFTVLVGLASGSGSADVGSIVGLFLVEIVGSLVLGFLAGGLVYRMMRSIEKYEVEVLLSVALAAGVYSLAASLHASGPLAVVVAGLFIGNTGRTLAMTEETRRHIDTFWELVDEVLNVVLFALIGLEVLVIQLAPTWLTAGAVAIPIVVLARFLSVGGTITGLRRLRTFSRHTVKILTWCGLRGGISVALALAIPVGVEARGLLLTMTYVVVVFSILVQGMTVAPFVRRLGSRA